MNFFASAAVFLCVCIGAVASDFVEKGPGRLSTIAAQSDFIVVAACVGKQPVTPPIYNLTFAVSRALKGKLESFTLKLNEEDSPSYDALAAGKPMLVFLKTDPDGGTRLTTEFSAVLLNANEGALPGVLTRELEIRSGPDARKAGELKRLILPLLANGGASYLEESLAEDLLDLSQADSLRLSSSELAMISRVATNTDYYKVALPLALVLVQQNAPQADDACFHVLTDTELLDKNASLRLAPVLAAKPELRERFVQKIEKSGDSDRIGRMMTQLYQVEPGTMDTIYERLWRNNAASHREVEHALMQSVTPTREQLLHRLKVSSANP